MFKEYVTKSSDIDNELKVEESRQLVQAENVKSLESKEYYKNINYKSSNSSIISIEFKKTKSKHFQNAVNLIINLPNYFYDESEGKYSFEIDEMIDYAKYYLLIEELIKITSRWKSSIIILDGKKYLKRLDYDNFKANVNQNSGGYEIVFKSSTEYGMDAVIFEELPLPLVYYPSMYGAFFGFSKDVEEKIFFCECERKGIENYVKLREQLPLSNYTGLKTAQLGTDCFSKHIAIISQKDKYYPLSQFDFKEGICFRCNNKIPKLKYCHPMYGTLFKQKYGWYVQQKFFELGIDRYQLYNKNVLKEECSPQLYDEVIKYSNLCFERIGGKYDGDLEERIEQYKKGIYVKIENMARVELGFAKIGEYWTSEVVMFKIVEGLYPDYKTKRHYRPKWLEGLEIDIYISGLELGFEYQGIQHYEPVEHWGGLEQLEKQQRNDRRKKELCEEHGVDLVIVDYNEELSTDYLKRKILSILGHK